MNMLISLFLTIVAFSANQGTALRLTIPNESGVKSVQIVWETKKVPASLEGDLWVTILGVDLDMKTGEHSADVLLAMADGHIEKREIAVQVVSKKYPTTELQVDDKYVELNKADLARANRESRETSAIYARITDQMLWTEPFDIPIPGEKSGTNFGHRRVFNGEPRAPHAGADLRAKTGTPIHATNRGRVVLAKNLFFTGNTVILDHGFGIYSLYAHLSRIDVRVGAIINLGQQVGLSGATGRVTGPHLHWGMVVQGARVDPFTLVNIK